MQCNPLQPCTIRDATFVGVLKSEAHGWFKTTQPTRSTTWEVRIVKDSIKEDNQDSIREVIFRRATVEDLIQGIVSTKEVHLISLLAKISADRRSPLSWRNCWYNSYRVSHHTRRVLMQ